MVHFPWLCQFTGVYTTEHLKQWMIHFQGENPIVNPVVNSTNYEMQRRAKLYTLPQTNSNSPLK